MKNKEKSIEKETEAYYKKIAKALPREGQKALLPGIRAGVESFLSENPGATMEDVIAYVGTPEEISNDFSANRDGKAITEEIKVGGKLVWVILISLFVVIFVFAVVLLIAFVYWNVVDHGFVEYTLEVASQGDLMPRAVTPAGFLGAGTAF